MEQDALEVVRDSPRKEAVLNTVQLRAAIYQLMSHSHTRVLTPAACHNATGPECRDIPDPAPLVHKRA